MYEFREGFVGGELQGRKGYGHGEGRGVGYIERAEAFGAEDFAGAVNERGVGGAVHLHALFDDVEGVHEGVRGDGRAGAGGGGGDGVVARGVAAHGLFYNFVCGKVDGVCGT